MAKTREIKGRMRAVGNIQRITKTMQMIATARFQAALRKATASRPYTKKIAELVAELAGTVGGNVRHPLLQANSDTDRKLVLVITSNRGLCGGYNANLLRNAMHFLRDPANANTELQVVGKKGLAYFRFAQREVSQFHSDLGDRPAFTQVDVLSEQYMKAFIAGQYKSVHVVYMSFKSMGRQTPEVLQLLPLRPPTVEGEKAQTSVDYDFSPAADVLLNEILPITVKTQLFQCFNEANVGEQIARMVAMKNATDSAGKMKKALSRKYNRARQAAITTELSEIISGSAALE